MKKEKQKYLPAVYYACGAIFMLTSALTTFFGEDPSAIPIVYLAIGSMWITLGAYYTSKLNKEKANVKYYDDNASDFAERTIKADMSETRDRFLQYIPEGGSILDWGCGSGRDSIFFKEAGYQVTSTDGSAELCRIAKEEHGLEVRNEFFSELNEENKYDGIWACASLLHVELGSLAETIELARHSMKKGGYMYMSFKYGKDSKDRDGRHFTDFTEETMTKFLKSDKKLEIVDLFVTNDVREDKADEKWINVIVRKIK